MPQDLLSEEETATESELDEDALSSHSTLLADMSFDCFSSHSSEAAGDFCCSPAASKDSTPQVRTAYAWKTM